ncbi:uncharacterized protein [Pyrus communis]|uniref:uncharacterized protein n=1 Tax=Pyrus communis TaxID=23211 RepID=UPI0035C1467C
MAGIVDGMVGIEGIVVGNLGSGLAGIGVAFGRVGTVGRVGNGVEGRGGKVALGIVGSEGSGGNVVLGRDGIVGTTNAGGEAAAGVSKRWRAAWLMWMLESDSTTTKDKVKKSLGVAMVEFEELL